MASSTTASLPIVDISPFLDVTSPSSPDDGFSSTAKPSTTTPAPTRASTVSALAAACRDYGFFYLTGHGISAAQRTAVLEAARAWFTGNSPEEKARIRRQDPGQGVGDGGRGYQMLAENQTAGHRDWHEGIDFYRPIVGDPDGLGEGLTPDDLEEHDEEEEEEEEEEGKAKEGDNDSGVVVVNSNGEKNKQQRKVLGLAPGQQGTKRPAPYGLLDGVNLWPSAEFQALYGEYIGSVRRVATAVLRAMGEALELRDVETFVRATRDSFWVMRVIGYPQLDAELAGQGGVSCGAHTDYGCLTLLMADDTRGSLQVLHRGEWIAADPIPGAYVVNVGDMVEKWTNGLVKSTLHRVVHTGQNYRVSVPFFFEPDLEAFVEPLPECVEKSGGVKIGDGIKYGDHLASKVSSNFYGG